MLKILSIFFFIIFVIPFLLRIALRLLFGSPSQQSQTWEQKRTTSSSSKTTQQPSQKKKVISKDEGEYIDYEEIKE